MTKPSTELAERPESGAIVMTDAEAELKAQIEEQELWLSLPFVQPRAIAQAGTPMTIVKVGTRLAKPIGDDDDDSEPEEQLVYLCEMGADLEYKNNAREVVTRKAGETVLVALKSKLLRQSLWNRMKELCELHGSIRNMTLRELPLSAKQRAKGWNPAITWCHVSQWKAL